MNNFVSILWKKCFIFRGFALLMIMGVGVSTILLLLTFVFSWEVFGETPPIHMKPVSPLNTTTPRYWASYFYGTAGNPIGTIDDNVIIFDNLHIENLDASRDASIQLSGKIQGQEGWFAFSENPVALSPGEQKTVAFTITVPDGICTSLYEAVIIANFDDYTGMPAGTGYTVSASIANEVFFNIDSGVPCLGGEVLPGLGAAPAYVPPPTFRAYIPIVVPGGGGGGPGPETICDDGLDNNFNGDIDCNDFDCFTSPVCQVETICNDGLDNDGDGPIDCADTDCIGDPACAVLPELICNDGIDNDGDGPIDCADSDCNGNPACAAVLPESICNDGLDNDGDGDVDCADSDCNGNPACVLGPELICDDGVDNDFDGFIDCADSDCNGNPACLLGPELICNDGLDNDGDGPIDCADSDCVGTAVCLPEVICSDGIDNDVDGDVDCADTDCAGDPACALGPELICNDGLDNDSDGPIDCADTDCATSPFCLPESICDDGIDNDGDGPIDCADIDCALDPVCALSMFYLTAYPEKRIPKAGGNWTTRGTLNFYGIGGSDHEFSVTTGDDGLGDVANTSVAPGFYYATFKGLSHLTKYWKVSGDTKQTIQVQSLLDNQLDFTLGNPPNLRAGDVALGKDDNVNAMDIAASIQALYLNDEHADLNRDFTVNAMDLAIEFYNLYESGDVLLEELNQPS